MTIIIITGGIDLSVGSILGLAGLMEQWRWRAAASIVTGVGVGIVTGLICGFLNGLMITQLKIAPFIVTLGTLGYTVV